MSCNYYRVTPEPPRAETYGFKKVTQDELVNIVSRLSKLTYNSRVHTVEAHKAHNYRQIHSAPPPRSPTHCPRRRLSTPNPNTITATTATTTTTTTTPTPNPINNDLPPTPSPNTPNSPAPPAAISDLAPDASKEADEADTTATTNENNINADSNTAMENNKDTIDEENSINASEPSTPAPLLPQPPPLLPPPPIPFAERKLTEKELKRFLRRIQRPTRAYVRSRTDYVPEEDDEIMAGDDFSTFNAVGRSRRPLTATERKKAFFLMSRPTTASRAKSSVECAFCPANDEEELKANRDLTLPFRYPHAPEEKVLKADEASSVVTRVSSPTRASLRGSGPPCYRSTPDYDSVRGQHPSLPLVSGLARTPTVSQIVNRLHYGNRRRVVVVVREEEDEREESLQDGEDRRGSRGTSEDEAEQRRRKNSARQQRQLTGNLRQAQNGRRGYHGYYTAATPITAWS
ncbi:hypothetical protein PoB_003944400 [Plakobranchus ocellatus]|uniref:Uncharacterized protein n=1 Tax=Plakobranchus ocellatus TaxID=259542 RepID=A0AAV4B2Q1_9GAST|nr:hypothetical protein PoB_003944400 [Plakobranchus ocellatus]